MRGRSLGLGGRLLLFSSVLLAIPWLGYRYIEEMKYFLLDGQQQAQLLAARAVATVLHDRSDLFDPSGGAMQAALEQTALYVYPIEDDLQIDGYATDWGALQQRRTRYGAESLIYTQSPESTAAPTFSLVMGERGDYIYGLLQVKDPHIIYRHPQYRRLDNSDQVRLELIGADGAQHRFVLLTEGQGDITAYAVQANWSDPVSGQPEFRLYGVWRERTDGYDLEFRFPAQWLGPQQRLSLSVVDVNEPRDRMIESIVATLPKKWSGALNRLVLRSPEVERILRGLGRSDANICVVDRYRRVRAVVGGQELSGKLCADTDKISQELVKDALEGRQNVSLRASPGSEDVLIVAAHPVHSDDEVIGAVLVEKNSAHILALQRNTLKRVALSTFTVFLLVVAGLLLFSGRLAFRIRRLQREAAAAIDSDGRIVADTLRADRASRDELGDLSRGISELLMRLQRYTGFLETVPRTLRHEILNPVNTISMTLQNLAGGLVVGNEQELLKSARQATRQLESIVSSLTEAAHIEDALKEDVLEVFDLAALVTEYVFNSSRLHPDSNLHYRGVENGVMVKGSDLRIAQLLDKVKDNALDFSPVHSQILFDLGCHDGWAELSVLNEGPEIPQAVLQALFVGMASCRPHTEGKPHLGIGLFIAKRIAMRHGGELVVDNRRDVPGVRVTLRLPLADEK